MTPLWIAVAVSVLALGFLSTVAVYAAMIVAGRESRREEREQKRKDRAA